MGDGEWRWIGVDIFYGVGLGAGLWLGWMELEDCRL